MSQKPGQAPHIFTPNTDPTAAENNPVGGGAEAVSAAGQTAVEVSTPPAPITAPNESSQDRWDKGLEEIRAQRAEVKARQLAKDHELSDRRRDHGIGNFTIVAKHARPIQSLEGLLAIEGQQPDQPLKSEYQKRTLRTGITKLVGEGHVDPVELLNDFIAGGVQRTVVLNLDTIAEGFNMASVSLQALSEPMVRLAEGAIEDGKPGPFLKYLHDFIEAGIPLNYAELTSGDIQPELTMPLLRSLDELSKVGVDTEDLKRRIGDSLNEILQAGQDLNIFARPHNLRVIESGLGIRIDRQELGQKMVNALARGGALTEGLFSQLRAIGVNTATLNIPTTSAG